MVLRPEGPQAARLRVHGHEGRGSLRALFRGLQAGRGPPAPAPDRGPPRRQAVRGADDQELPTRQEVMHTLRSSLLAVALFATPAAASDPFNAVAEEVNPKVVKLFGGG